jgi:hypothetical protein
MVIPELHCVSCEVETEYLNILQKYSCVRRLEVSETVEK